MINSSVILGYERNLFEYGLSTYGAVIAESDKTASIRNGTLFSKSPRISNIGVMQFR